MVLSSVASRKSGGMATAVAAVADMVSGFSGFGMGDGGERVVVSDDIEIGGSGTTVS